VTIIDKVLFLFPKDRELQFAAAAILQNYVNGFGEKMRVNNPVPNHKAAPVFELSYDVSIDPKDWQLLKSIGLKIKQEPVPMDSHPDAVIDLREERLEMFKDSTKHVCQIMGIMCGILCPPLPEIRMVKPRSDVMEWGVLNPFLPVPASHIDANVLLDVENDQLTGVIGNAGWETYLSASRGLPTIEVMPEGRARMWLSKWTNMAYRVVEPWAGDLTDQIMQAKQDLEEMVKQCSIQAQAKDAA
jgi:hypothetical protein